MFARISLTNLASNSLVFNWLLILALVLVGVALFNPQSTGAITDQSGGDAVKSHCLKVLASSASDACGSRYKNIEHAKNAASYHCQEIPIAGGKKANCITSKANRFIDDANASKPRTAKAFTSRLDAVLDKDIKKTGGSVDTPSSDAQQALSPEVSCLAKDGSCGDCSQRSDPNCLDATNDPAACAADPHLEGCGNDANSACTTHACDLVKKYVNPLIEALTIIFGLIAVASIIMGGIQYSSSAGDPQKVTMAKRRIGMTIVAIVAYAFLFGFLQFLIPGGIFK